MLVRCAHEYKPSIETYTLKSSKSLKTRESLPPKKELTENCISIFLTSIHSLIAYYHIPCTLSIFVFLRLCARG